MELKNNKGFEHLALLILISKTLQSFKNKGQCRGEGGGARSFKSKLMKSAEVLRSMSESSAKSNADKSGDDLPSPPKV
jgi:hypothetical protein